MKSRNTQIPSVSQITAIEPYGFGPQACRNQKADERRIR